MSQKQVQRSATRQRPGRHDEPDHGIGVPRQGKPASDVSQRAAAMLVAIDKTLKG